MDSQVFFSLAPNISSTPTWQFWSQLDNQVGGRLYGGMPFAQLCYDNFTSCACADVRCNYLDEGAANPVFTVSSSK